jgi:hypothetical protein
MKICQNCLNPIIGCGSKFCSLSCAAIYNNNRLGTGKINEKGICLNCKKEYKIGKNAKGKYCSHKCQREYLDKDLLFEKNTKLSGHKRVLIKERGHYCEKCHNKEWLNKSIPLELHHIDGDRNNQEKINLLLLCPNCHTLTENYGSKNKYKKRIHISDEKIISLINKKLNNHKILENLNMNLCGDSYKRINKLRSEIIMPS